MKDMSYETFCERMKNIVQQYYGVEADVKLQAVQKVNGVVLQGITVMNSLSRNAWHGSWTVFRSLMSSGHISEAGRFGKRQRRFWQDVASG